MESTEERGHSTGEERRRSEGKSASVAEENPSVALSCWGDFMKSCSEVLSSALGGRYLPHCAVALPYTAPSLSTPQPQRSLVFTPGHTRPHANTPHRIAPCPGQGPAIPGLHFRSFGGPFLGSPCQLPIPRPCFLRGTIRGPAIMSQFRAGNMCSSL